MALPVGRADDMPVNFEFLYNITSIWRAVPSCCQ